MQDNLALSKLDCYNREQRGSLYINMERALDHTVQLKKKPMVQNSIHSMLSVMYAE